MPTSVPGNSRRRTRGFTLIELLIVVAMIAISVGVITLSLRDPSAGKLEEEGARLSALLEMARSEARAAGAAARWVPAPAGSEDASSFAFVGLSPSLAKDLPTHWLDPATRAQVIAGTSVLLGPEAILPPQRIVLRLADQRLELASDGLGAFAVATPAAR